MSVKNTKSARLKLSCKPKNTHLSFHIKKSIDLKYLEVNVSIVFVMCTLEKEGVDNLYS